MRLQVENVNPNRFLSSYILEMCSDLVFFFVWRRLTTRFWLRRMRAFAQPIRGSEALRRWPKLVIATATLSI